jgi:hypothetical protein
MVAYRRVDQIGVRPPVDRRAVVAADGFHAIDQMGVFHERADRFQ